MAEMPKFVPELAYPLHSGSTVFGNSTYEIHAEYSRACSFKKAFTAAGIELHFEGSNESEIAKDKEGNIRVAVDPAYYRPTEVDLLLGDATKAREKLGWKPKYDLDSLVKEMVEEDLRS